MEKIKSILILLIIIILILSLMLASGCEIMALIDKMVPDSPGQDPLDYELSEDAKLAREAEKYAEDETTSKEDPQKPQESEEAKQEKLPDKPITYYCQQGGIRITIIIDFKTTEVTGEIVNRSSTGEKVLYAEIDGTINIEDFFVEGTFNGFNGEDQYSGTITGVVTDNLDTFIGAREWNRDHNPIDITAYR